VAGYSIRLFNAYVRINAWCHLHATVERLHTPTAYLE
jgi:hypothetical protein